MRKICAMTLGKPVVGHFASPPRQVHPAGADRSDSPYWRPIKYSLFPPLGLATLAAYLAPDDEAVHRRRACRAAHLDDAPDLVVIQVYITNAYRAYRIADHYRSTWRVRRAWADCTSPRCRRRRAAHADAIFLGPGRADVPAVSSRTSAPATAQPVYASTSGRTLDAHPADPPRSDPPRNLPRAQLDRRHARLPAALRLLLQGRLLRGRPIVLHAARRRCARRDRRACPAAISIFSTIICSATAGSPRRCSTGMRGMGRLFQGAATVDSILRGDLIERAAEAGLRSMFVGFETLTPGQSAAQQQAPESRPRLHGGDRPPARPRHHDQRQLRLRHGRRR